MGPDHLPPKVEEALDKLLRAAIGVGRQYPDSYYNSTGDVFRVKELLDGPEYAAFREAVKQENAKCKSG